MNAKNEPEEEILSAVEIKGLKTFELIKERISTL
jgi:hypothetical protein